MDLNFVLKLCWTIIVVILTLIAIGAFIETIINKFQEPKRRKEKIEALDKLTDEFIKAIAEEKQEKKAPKKTTRKTTKKKED